MSLSFSDVEFKNEHEYGVSSITIKVKENTEILCIGSNDAGSSNIERMMINVMVNTSKWIIVLIESICLETNMRNIFKIKPECYVFTQNDECMIKSELFPVQMFNTGFVYLLNS